jgi:hypothetical protein
MLSHSGQFVHLAVFGPNVDGSREASTSANGPEEIDLYSEIPMHAQLWAIIEGHLGDSISQTLSKQYGLLLGSRDLRVRSVSAEIGEAKLFKLPVRSARPEDTDRRARRRRQVGWCSTIFYNGVDVSLELTALAGSAVPSTGESTNRSNHFGSPANPLALPGNDQRGTSLCSHGH